MEKSAAGYSRLFSRYRAEPDGAGGFVLKEDFQELDRATGRYFEKTIVTTIRLAPACTDIDGVIERACALREEVDRDGVKLYFDRPKQDPENVYPKWKYRLGGQFKEVPIDRTTIDAEVMALVHATPDFYRDPVYKKWYGRKMQHMREGIIIQQLLADFPDAVVPREGDAIGTQNTPNGTASTADAAELSAGITMLIDNLVHLYTLPDDTEKLTEHVNRFAAGLFEYRFGRNGAVAKPRLPQEKISKAVHRALTQRFAEDRAVLAALANVKNTLTVSV